MRNEKYTKFQKLFCETIAVVICYILVESYTAAHYSKKKKNWPKFKQITKQHFEYLKYQNVPVLKRNTARLIILATLKYHQSQHH